ncbi:MAG: ABC transporter permease subunit [Thermodesulfobacteriota bacterium]
MRQVPHVLKKEFKDYFVSPIAYIVISIFLVVTGWFFFSTFFLYGQANLRNFFSLLPIIFAFVIPAITMRLLAEELNRGSYELLLTMPVRYTDIVVGKFAAGVVMTAAMLIPTLFYPISIAFLGDLDWGPVIGGYIGALLLGGAFSAIGLFASSLTENQIIAFILGAAICVGLTLVDKMLFFFPEPLLNVIEYIGSDYHFQNIAKGIIDTRDIIYFISVMFLGLYATYLSLQHKE